MWIYKQHGVLPNQYHHFYNQGETIIYPEHLQDLLTVDKMWNNKIKKEEHKEKAKQQLKQDNNPLKNNSNFYNKKYVYNNNNK